MAIYGPFYPSGVIQQFPIAWTGQQWTNPSGARVSQPPGPDDYASITSFSTASYLLSFRDFQINIPDNLIIEGIRVGRESHATFSGFGPSGVYDYYVNLFALTYGTGIGKGLRPLNVISPGDGNGQYWKFNTPDGTGYYGNFTDKWGFVADENHPSGLLGSMINQSGFQVIYAATGTSHASGSTNGFLDSIFVEISAISGAANFCNLFMSGALPSIASGLDLYISGPQESMSGIDLFTLGPLPTDSGVDLFVHGHDSFSGSVDLYTAGHIQETGGLDLYIYGYDIHSGNLDLFLKTPEPVGNPPTGALNLFVKTVELSSGTNGINLSIFGNTSGVSGQTSNTPLFLEASNYPSNLNLYVKADDSEIPSGILNLFLDGVYSSVDGSVSLFIGSSGISKNLNLFTEGLRLNDFGLPGDNYIPFTGGLNLILFRSDITENLNLYLQNQVIDSGLNLFVSGAFIESGNLPLVLMSKDNLNNSMKLYSRGF